MVPTYSGSPDEKEEISRQHLSISLESLLRSSLDLAMARTMNRTVRKPNSRCLCKNLTKQLVRTAKIIKRARKLAWTNVDKKMPLDL